MSFDPRLMIRRSIDFNKAASRLVSDTFASPPLRAPSACGCGWSTTKSSTFRRICCSPRVLTAPRPCGECLAAPTSHCRRPPLSLASCRPHLRTRPPRLLSVLIIACLFPLLPLAGLAGPSLPIRAKAIKRAPLRPLQF